MNYHHKDSVAQWIRRWSTEPEILGSIPSGVVVSQLFSQVAFQFCSIFLILYAYGKVFDVFPQAGSEKK